MPTTYAVSEIYPCIQGEGVKAGTPMHMVRLQGCGVGCFFCDTKYTWEVDPARAVETLDEANTVLDRFTYLTAAQIIESLPPGPIEWILLSGGEPAEQDLNELCRYAHASGYHVAVETSGTATGFMDEDEKVVDWLTLSPKPASPTIAEIQGAALTHADELKWLVGKYQDVLNLQIFLSNFEHLLSEPEIFVQPISMGGKATELAVAACHEHGWRLSAQTQKFLHLR